MYAVGAVNARKPRRGARGPRSDRLLPRAARGRGKCGRSASKCRRLDAATGVPRAGRLICVANLVAHGVAPGYSPLMGAIVTALSSLGVRTPPPHSECIRRRSAPKGRQNRGRVRCPLKRNTSMQEPLRRHPTRCCRCATSWCFPHMIVPLFVGREKSVRALEEVMRMTSRSCCRARSTQARTIPQTGIYKAGVLANVLQLLKLPDGTVKVLVEGQRARADHGISSRTIISSRLGRVSDRNAGRRHDDRGAGAHCCGKNSNVTPRSRRTSPKRRWPRCRTRPSRPSWLILSRVIWASR